MTVLMERFDFTPRSDDAPLAGLQITTNVTIVRRGMRIRHQHLHIAAQNLFGLVAEQSFCAVAPRFDAAAFVDRDDRVDDVVENRR